MNRRWRTLRLCIVFLFMPAPAFAHHSGAIYDTSQMLTIEGTVTRVAWANPHVYIHLEQVAETGEVIEWAVELSPPAAMRRIGWTSATLRPGDAVTIVGSPTRRTTNRGILPDTIQAAGLTLLQAETVLPRLSSVSTPPAVRASGLAGTWETLANVDLYVFFYTARMQLTEAGLAARAAFDEATMSPALECIPYSSPLLMIDPDFKQITVEEDVITIQGGFAPAERIIHMNVATHDGAEPSLQGHSIGAWEGDTLVIDTAGFAPHRSGNGYLGTSSGAQKHLVERLTLVEGGTRLSYAFEMTDPEYLSEAVTGAAEWAYRPDLEFVREPCDLGNAREFINE
jgi:hypothetical protein